MVRTFEWLKTAKKRKTQQPDPQTGQKLSNHNNYGRYHLNMPKLLPRTSEYKYTYNVAYFQNWTTIIFVVKMSTICRRAVNNDLGVCRYIL